MDTMFVAVDCQLRAESIKLEDSTDSREQGVMGRGWRGR